MENAKKMLKHKMITASIYPIGGPEERIKRMREKQYSRR